MQSPGEISKLLEERQALSQQLRAYLAEREQLLVVVQSKHQEAVAYHGEVVRLSALLKEGAGVQGAGDSGEGGDALERLREEYHERKQQVGML